MAAPWLADLLDLCLPARCVACDERPPLPADGWRPAPLCRACLRGLPEPQARCAACGRRTGPLPPEDGTGAPAWGCHRCAGPLAVRDALTWSGVAAHRRRRALRGVVAPWSYGGVPRDLVLALKFHGRLGAAAPLAAGIAAALRRADRPGDLVLHVPLSWRRRRSRGHDQARLLAARVARSLGIPGAARALRRRRHTAAQTSLPRSARRRAPRGAFVARSRAVRGRCVILVDDVLTSGATAVACARALRRAGALAVTAAVACRAERGPAP